MEGWVDLGSWVCPRWFTCQQTVTHPSSNRAQCRPTMLIETNVLTTTPCRHPCVDYNSSTCDTSVDMQQNNYQNITINFLDIPQGSPQATKIKFPDISLTVQAGFRKLQTAQVAFIHLVVAPPPLHRPLAITFPRKYDISSFRHIQHLQLMYLSKQQPFLLSQCIYCQLKIQIINVSLANAYENVNFLPWQTAKFLTIPWHSSQSRNPQLSLIFKKVGTLIPLHCNFALKFLQFFWQKIRSQVKTKIHKNTKTQRNTPAHNYCTRMYWKIDTNIDRPSLSTSGWYFTNDVYGQEPPTC